MKLTEAINDYLQYLIVNQMKAKTTVDRYQVVLKQYQTYLANEGIDQLEGLETAHILNYLNQLHDHYKARTIAQSLSIIRSFHNYIASTYPQFNNPAIKLKTIQVKQSLPGYFKPTELAAFFATFTQTDKDIFHRAIFEMLYATGLRVSELVNLTFQELNTSNLMLKIIGKGHKERIVPLAEYSLNVLTTYLTLRQNWNQQKHPLIFIKPNGQPISRQYVWLTMKKQLKIAGLNPELSPHSFRHTFATDLLANEADLRIVQELLGHANVTTTQIYTHIADQRLINIYDKFHPKSTDFSLKKPKDE